MARPGTHERYAGSWAALKDLVHARLVRGLDPALVATITGIFFRRKPVLMAVEPHSLAWVLGRRAAPASSAGWRWPRPGGRPTGRSPARRRPGRCTPGWTCSTSAATGRGRCAWSGAGPRRCGSGRRGWTGPRPRFDRSVRPGRVVSRSGASHAHGRVTINGPSPTSGSVRAAAPRR
jgi:hypothetical protein